nr:hypothetical protein [Tanacetum cinerariifolium]
MDMTIDQQVALDEALVPHASRPRIGKSNFRLRSDITFKKSTLQLVYDVLRLTPFYKAFLVTEDVPEIYMQEFWATATVHHHSIRFKIDNKKRIVNLEYFMEMLHIYPRLPNQTFDELPFEEEILAFLRYLRHSGKIRKVTDVNINKLHQPWRSFAVVINKCLSGKSTGYDSLRFKKVIIYFFMTKDPSIPRRNKRFGAILPIELTNKDIRNSHAYKEYYAIASGAAPPKLKRVSQRLRVVAMTKAEQMKLATKRSLQQTNISQASGSGADEGTDDQEDEDDQDDDDDNQDNNDDDQNTNNDNDKLVDHKLSIHEEEAKYEESFDPIVQTPKNSDDEGNDDASLGMNVGGEEGYDAEDDNEELYRDVNINLEGRDVQMTNVHTTQEFEDTHVTLTPVNPDGQQQSSSLLYQFVTSMLNPSPDAGIKSLLESTPRVDVQASTTVAPLTLTALTLPPPTIPTISQIPQAQTPPTTALRTFLLNLPNFGSLFGFDHRIKTLEANFSEFMQTNQFARAVSSILEIVERYIDQQMNEAVKVAVQLQSDMLRDEAQAENEDFINKLYENIQKIIKKKVKEQVKVQVFKILTKIKKIMNEQLEAKVLTRSSNSSKTSYVVAVDLSEMELKKILIEKMESNKSIHRLDEQMDLYKALNPLLDQTGGPREEEKEKSQSQQALQKKRRPRPPASLLKGPNLIKRLQAILHQQRSQCRQLKI